MLTRTLIITLTICGAVVASGCSKSPQGRRHIKLSTSAPQAPFSDGVRSGGTLYLAGRLGIDPKTQKVVEDPREEVRLILDGMKATLAEAEMTMDNLVAVQVFCLEPDRYYDLFNEVYRSYFKGPLPARAFLGSGTLLRGARFEVLGIASRE